MPDLFGKKEMFVGAVPLLESLLHRYHKMLVLNSGLFDSEWYKLAYPYVVRDNVDPLTHFVRNGRKYLLAPGPAFDTERYLEQHEVARRSRLNPVVHYLKYGKALGLEIHTTPPSAADRIIASGLFDEEWYCRRYPDVVGAGYTPLLHYLIDGISEHRSPGPDFDAEWYVTHYPDVAGCDPLLHYLDYGRIEGRSAQRPTRIMKLAMETVSGVEDLEPELYAANFFEKIDHIEVRNGRARHRTARVFEAVIEAVPEPPRSIVFMPWLIHGGADLVACHAVRALVETYTATSVLVVLTDHDKEEAKHLLPPGVPSISFSRIDPELSLSERVELLDLLVRGLQPDVILNVNSRACWEAVRIYGSRLSRFTRLYAMLFCPDFSPTGRRNGYSDLYLRECLPHLSGIYFDNRTHIDEMVRQFSIPEELRRRLVTLYQPSLRGSCARHSRPTGAPLSVLWVGRLAAQKNIDLLVAIAEAAPHFVFHVWGRGERLFEEMVKDLARRCGNVRFHGPYNHFNDLPLSSYGALLYTSRWDGLPNVLLEAAAAGLPIVASRVGGVGELVDCQTGWLIEDFNDPTPYISALNAIARDVDDAKSRTQEMSRRLTRNHNWDAYRSTLTHEPNVTGGLLNAASPLDHRGTNSASRRTAGQGID